MLEIMRCTLCGKLALIIRDGGRRTICCDQLMETLPEQTDGEKMASHAPAIEWTEDGIHVRVGSVPSPMTESHAVEWIEAIHGPYLQVKGLKPGDMPDAAFVVSDDKVKVRTYCEEHGLWVRRASRR
jgi:superoxide reductase